MVLASIDVSAARNLLGKVLRMRRHKHTTSGGLTLDNSTGSLTPDKTVDSLTNDKSSGSLTPGKTVDSLTNDKSSGSLTPGKTADSLTPGKTVD